MKLLLLLAALLLSQTQVKSHPILQGKWWVKYTGENKSWTGSECDQYGSADTSEGLKCRNAFQIKSCMSLERLKEGYTAQFIPVYRESYPVEDKTAIWVHPGKLEQEDGYWTCKPSSIVRLYCKGGSCQVYPSGGEYGFHPMEYSQAAIDDRKWAWQGDHPDSIGYQMWKSLKNGSRFAYQLSWWVDDYVTGVETVVIPSGLKDYMYRESLKKPGY